MSYQQIPPLGQKTAANSLPVVLASDVLPIFQLSGSTNGLALESGNLLAAKVDLDILVARTPVLGQGVISGSRSVVLASDQMATNNVDQAVQGLPIRQISLTRLRTSFAGAFTNTVDSAYWTLVKTGSGQTINQTGGKLIITGGTTANSETIIRSLMTFKNALRAKWSITASQRIVNTNYIVELVDLVGANLAYSITNATTVVVTFATNPFTSVNVGQKMTLGNITGAAGIPMQATIASVSGLTVTYTVAGWPATGTGTLDVFGWNYMQTIYSGVTATQCTWDSQRVGYNQGVSTITIQATSVAQTHVVQTENDTGSFTDMGNTGTSFGGGNYPSNLRGSRLQFLPDDNTVLYLQVRCLNGTTNPASNTTWTLDFINVENYVSQSVNITGLSPMAFTDPLPVQFFNPQSTSPSITIGSTTTAAASDATANPTAPFLRDAIHLFNGTTWDRLHGNWNTVTGDTGAKAASFVGATQTNFDSRGATITVLLGTVSGTTPTLTAQLQWSPDAGTTWIPFGPISTSVNATANTIVFQVYPTNQSVSGAAPAALTTGGTVTVQLNTVLPRTWRINYVITGTTPSFAITAVYVNYNM